MDTQGKLDWIETKLKSRELQHATFKRDDDCIRLLITEVRLLVDTVAALRAERDALAEEVKALTMLALEIRHAAAFALDSGDEGTLRPTLEQVHSLACEATE